MKQIKNLLCLLLVLCMIQMPMLTMAESTDAVYDRQYASDLAFLESLGITDGIDKTDSERNLSRAEFVAMAVKIINPNLSVRFTGSFEDVTSDTRYSNEIYTALAYGMLNGTSQATFSPDDPINYAAALKILVAALGYEEYAYINGGYPTGYVAQANAIDLTDGIASHAVSDTVSLETGVSLIANALKCDLRKVVSVADGYVETKVIYGSNCLTEYFSLTKTSGILYTAGSHSMIYGYAEETPSVQIGDTVLACSLSDIEKYLGCNVIAWYDSSKMELRAFELTDDNKTVSIDASDVIEYDSFTLRAYENGGDKERTYKLDKGFSFVLGGRLISPEKSDFLFDEGTLVLKDNSGDGAYDVVCASKKEYLVVKGYNSSTKTVYGKESGDINVVLKNEDGYFYKLEKNGIKVDASAIVADDVLEVTQSRDGFVSDVKISSEYVKGTITGIGKDAIFIDGAEYEYNSYFKNHFTPELNQSGTFLLDRDSKITYISSLYRERVEYGYFLDFQSKASGLSSSRKIKLLNLGGTIEIADLADKVRLDGTLLNKESAEDEKTLTNTLINEATGIPIYQLIRYGTDAEGRVNLIDTSSELDNSKPIIEKYEEVPSTDDSLTKYVDAQKTSSYWRKAANAFVPFFTLGNTVMISVPKDLRTKAPADRYTDDAFRVITTSDLPSYETVYADAYDYDHAMSPRVVVLYNGSAEAGVSGIMNPLNTATVHVVESISDVIDEDGTATKRIDAYANGKFVSYNIDPELYGQLESKNLIPESGDVVRFSFGSKYINGIGRDAIYNKATNNLSISYTGTVSTNPVATLTYVSGKVFSQADTYSLVIATDNYPSSSSYPTPADGLCSIKASSSTKVVIYNTKTGGIEHGRITELADIRSVGEDGASYVCVRLDGYEPELIVIYK